MRSGSKVKGRKRTKTGCLTCRKRRIKCDEERPTCNNCLKSNRPCEGYNQRLVFKDPLSNYRPSSSASSHIPFTSPSSNFPSFQQGGEPVTNSQRAEWKVRKPAPVSDDFSGYLPEHLFQNVEDKDSLFDVSDDDVFVGEAYSTTLHGESPDHVKSFEQISSPSDILSTYVPSNQASLLRDSSAARIFFHFVKVVAPSISMFERHSANPSLLVHGQPAPRSQQHIWIYTLPRMALQNPALLHAILALGSLHIAKLQGGPITVSLKHYALSIRRISKSIGLPTGRNHPAILAACMLLAFHECWCADHQKWTNHLFGAQKLLREIDFESMTNYKKRSRIQDLYPALMTDLRVYQREHDVNENITGMLMGKKLIYNEFGQILDDTAPQDVNRTYSERDLELYEIQRDLFWWYCKQDVYHSILGGETLFLDYKLWSSCPPRAPLGRLNATYGTFDHLILVLGRLATFAAKDLNRKKLAMKANGNRWVPPESKFPTPLGTQTPSAKDFSQIPLTVSGLFDSTGPGFKQAYEMSGSEPLPENVLQSINSDHIDLESLESQRIEVEEEWHDIRNSFSILQEQFGDDFQSLGPDFAQPTQSPFGPVLRYRTYPIAGIWMNFYMGLIVCYRCHPEMPPSAMAAAGLAARQTASFANKLCLIAAGIAPDCSKMREIDPAISAALIESSTCLFVAGVESQDTVQRAWIIRRLRDINRLTGWETATSIAAGCETAWIKMAELGRGTLYTRLEDEEAVFDASSSTSKFDRVLYGSISEKPTPDLDSDTVHFAPGILRFDTGEGGAEPTNELPEGSSKGNTESENVFVSTENKVPQDPFTSLKSILSNWVAAVAQVLRLRLWEPEIPNGKIRIRWKCKCGESLYDDFQENQIGAAKRLEFHLNDPGSNSNSNSNSMGSNRLPGTMINFASSIIIRLRNIFREEETLPQHAPQTVPGTQTPHNPPARPTEMLYLLLCHSKGIYATKLLQLPVADFRSDNQLFTVLRSQYKSMRGQWWSFMSFRTLTSIRFVRFEMYKKSQSVDILKKDDIPPADHVEYKYDPVPIDIIPPVGENQLRHFFYYPEHAEDEPACLDRFPKKLREEFAVCNGKPTGTGWGLHLVDGWDSRKTWTMSFVLFGLGSILWGALWTLFKKSIQDAFAVSGFMIALALLTVGFTQAMVENMNG